MDNTPAYTIEICDINTGEAVETMHADNFRDAMRIADGANINLDHTRFLVSIAKNDL